MVRTIPSRLFLLAAAAALGACAAPPADLDLALTRPTLENRFVVALLPPAKPAAINQIHAWQIRLTSPSGLPVSGAQIAVDGGMPQHGHGLPTQPQVTPLPVAGSYLLEGVKFSMPGWWEIKLAVQAQGGSDKVTFNTMVATPASAP